MSAAGPRVAIIGAGMSGLCMATKLQDAGIDSYTIFEQASDVGGTWRDNTYPGLACDIPSRYYSYSFRPNPAWSHLLPPGAEVQAYFQQVAQERGIRRHIRFDTEIASARYEDGQWRIRNVAGGEEFFDVLIAATGVLRVPRYPQISNLEAFAGPTFHSSRWDHSVSLAGKRIGVIGTGSTGVQIVSALAREGHRLTVFQRTPQWIFPLPNPKYTRLTRWAFRRWPQLNMVSYRFWQMYVEEIFGRAAVEPCWQRRVVSTVCRWNLRLAVRDKALRQKLTPQDQPMCKRMVYSGRYFRALQQPAVTVVSDAIDHVDASGIVTADGMLHELDVLVCATGFDAHAFVRPMQVVGEHGLSLDEAWADGPRAYRSVAVPGFPNMFMLMGPHSPIGNQSLIPIAENQADYAMWWINQMREGKVAAASPTTDATDRYNQEMKAAMPQTVWATGCKSWYLGDDGLPELFPWRPQRHRELLRQPQSADFDVRIHQEQDK